MMANHTGRYTTTYDELQRKRSVITPVGKIITSSYDATSRRTQMNVDEAGGGAPTPTMPITSWPLSRTRRMTAPVSAMTMVDEEHLRNVPTAPRRRITDATECRESLNVQGDQKDEPNCY